MRATTTLVVDDNASFRQRVKEMFADEPDLVVIGEAADGWEAIRKARELRPALVIMDLRMPGINGLDATRELKRQIPETRVLILGQYDLEEYRKAAAASSASGYVIKRSLISAFLPAIREIIGDENNADALRRQTELGISLSTP